MISQGAAAPKALSAAACSYFNTRRERIPLTSTCQQRRNNIITCDMCHKQLKEISLPQHMHTHNTTLMHAHNVNVEKHLLLDYAP